MGVEAIKETRRRYVPESEQSLMEQLHVRQDGHMSAIVDLDETFFNTVKFWVGTYNDILEKRFSVPRRKLPTTEDVYLAGGTDNVYKTYYPDLESFELEAEALRQRSANSFEPEPMEDEMAQKIARAFSERNGRHIIGAITARPGIHNIIRATRLQFLKHKVANDSNGLHSMPIIGRPERVSVKETTDWKMGHLERLQRFNSKKLLVIIDDSLSLAKAIEQRNENRSSETLPLIQVVYPGPNTLPKIRSGSFQSNPELGVYLSDWSGMPDTLTQVETRWPILQN